MSLVVFPLIALVIPTTDQRLLINGLFFWPQYLLLPSGIREQGADASSFNAGATTMLAVLAWLGVMALYARCTLSWRFTWALLGLCPSTVLVAAVVFDVLNRLGYSPVLDGL
jgi:hypothetical protein